MGTMKSLNLAECQISIISLTQDNPRAGAVSGLCTRLGLSHEVVPAVECRPGWIGCALSHLKALRGWDGYRPLLILEDDVAISEHFSTTIEIPADSDALYLGTSIYGGVPLADWVGFEQVIAAEPAGDGLVRVHNLLGAHAIVHISPAWISAAMEQILRCTVEESWAHDRGFASIQGDFRVYARIDPPFYQATDLQPPEIGYLRERATRVPLPVHPVGKSCTIGLAEGAKAIRLDWWDGRFEWREIAFEELA